MKDEPGFFARRRMQKQIVREGGIVRKGESIGQQYYDHLVRDVLKDYDKRTQRDRSEPHHGWDGLPDAVKVDLEFHQQAREGRRIAPGLPAWAVPYVQRYHDQALGRAVTPPREERVSLAETLGHVPRQRQQRDESFMERVTHTLGDRTQPEAPAERVRRRTEIDRSIPIPSLGTPVYSQARRDNALESTRAQRGLDQHNRMRDFDNAARQPRNGHGHRDSREQAHSLDMVEAAHRGHPMPGREDERRNGHQGRPARPGRGRDGR